MRRSAVVLLTALVVAAPAVAHHIPYGDPALPEQVACDFGPFPLEALRGPRFAERRRTLPAAALRRFIRKEGRLGGGFPLRGYRQVLRSRDEALFVAGHPPRMSYVRMEREDGRWSHNQYGECRLEPVHPTGEAAGWRVDPDAPPRPDSTEVALLVTERSCASGQPATGRIEEPLVFTDARRVVVSVFVRHAEGGQECPGNPETPYVLRLAEPLGDRQLLDGGVVPARRRFPR